MAIKQDFVVTISADGEWRTLRKYITTQNINNSPFGEWLYVSYDQFPELIKPIIFIHGGWGKVSAAASTQYAIDRWHPRLLINLGTCGGFEGEIGKGEIVLVEKSIIYDIYEQMGDPEEHIRHYSTEIDNSWLKDPLPLPVTRTVLLSADRDLLCDDIPMLKRKYDAIAGDWESGAIAWVAGKNRTPCLILRGVTDLVSEKGGEAYLGNVGYYYENTDPIMKRLIDSLPAWLLRYMQNFPG